MTPQICPSCGDDHNNASLCELCTLPAGVEPVSKAPDYAKPAVDPNVESARAMLLARSVFGIKKYGCTTEALSATEAISHAVEEASDQLVYLTAAKEAVRKMGIELKALRDSVADAPHALNCDIHQFSPSTGDYLEKPCDCWKSKSPAQTP